MKSELVEKRRKAMEQIISGLDDTYIIEAINYKRNKETIFFWGYLKKAAAAMFIILLL